MFCGHFPSELLAGETVWLRKHPALISARSLTIVSHAAFPDFGSRIHNNVLPGNDSGVSRVCPFLFFARKADVVFYLQKSGLAGMCH